MKKALITGVTGQDGSYLAELLLSKGYKVYGLVRRSSTNTTTRIAHLLYPESNLSLIEGEVSDSGCVYQLVASHKFDEIYNLAAQSHVGTSFDQPDYTFQVNALGPLHFLEAIRRFSPKTRFYQASTSEMFGKNFTEQFDAFDGRTTHRYQDEHTEFMPQSPYAVAKLAAHNSVRIYREAYDVHASAGILFNHESERRGENFVTRKITKWIGEFYNWAKDKSNDADNPFDWLVASPDSDEVYFGGRTSRDQGLQFPKLRLGNIDAYRDWGHAEDYVHAMWCMLQMKTPDDYVIATGETYSVRDFLREAFYEIGISDFEPYIVVDPKFYRPAEVDYLRGNPTKAENELNWVRGCSFKQLVKRMVWSDINGKKEGPQTLQQKKVLQK